MKKCMEKCEEEQLIIKYIAIEKALAGRQALFEQAELTAP